MKNTKLSTLILGIISLLGLAIDILKENAELIGMDVKVLALITTVFTIIKMVYDNRHLLTQEQADKQTANYANENNRISESDKGGYRGDLHTTKSVQIWRSNKL